MFSFKQFQSLKHFFQGFTLVELIVVISVLAVLATISFSQVGNITKNARDASRTTSISNIKWSLEIFYAQKGRYPFPDNPITLTWAWNSKLYKGTITTAVLPWLNTDTKDPTTNSPYQYATLSNTHYQIGTNLEWTTSLNQTLTNQTFAESTSTNTIPYIKWNYTFDPSLPSLFPIGTSSGIFSPTTCFILESSTSPNNFSSTAADCTPKSQTSFKNLDTSLIGYWDMETKTGTLLKDLSGNGNDGVFSGGMDYTTALTGAMVGQGLSLSNSGYSIEVPDTVTGSVLDITGDFTQTITFFYKDVSLATNGLIYYSKWVYPDYNYKLSTFSPGSLKKYRFEFALGLNSTQENLASQTLAYSGSWYNIVSTYLASTREMKLYVNGKLEGTYQATGSVLSTNNYPLIFWKYFPSKNYSLYGILDEAKLYNRTLSAEEIAQQAKIAGF